MEWRAWAAIDAGSKRGPAATAGPTARDGTVGGGSVGSVGSVGSGGSGGGTVGGGSVGGPAGGGTGAAKRLLAAARGCIAIDSRALAVLRMAAGVLVLADLLLRVPDLGAFYTDDGILPRGHLDALFGWFRYVSLHALSGQAGWQGVLFVAAAASALLLAVGYRSRASSVVVFLLHMSLLARNPLVLDSGDSLLLLLLFWMMFLPVGAAWSADAWRRARSQAPEADARAEVAGPGAAPVVDMAGAGLLIQVVLVYLVNGVMKSRSEVWHTGEALLYVFRLELFATPLGAAMVAFPTLLSVLGKAWLVLLLASPLVILLSGRARLLLVAAFASAHVAMALTMTLGLFPWISLAALVPFVPARAWNAVEERLVTPVAARLMAPAAARLLVASGPGAAMRHTTAATDPATGATATKHAAATDTAMTAAGPATGSAAPPPRRPPPRHRLTLARVRSGALASLILLTLALNGASLGLVPVPAAAEAAVAPHANGWVMFADPPRWEHWYVAPAVLASGEAVDALHGGDVSWQDPPPLQDVRWRNFLLDIRRSPDAALMAEGLAAYLCHDAPSRHGEALVNVTIYHVRSQTFLDGEDGPARASRLVTHPCMKATSA